MRSRRSAWSASVSPSSARHPFWRQFLPCTTPFLTPKPQSGRNRLGKTRDNLSVGKRARFGSVALSRRGARSLILPIMVMAVFAGTVASAAIGGIAGAQEISVTRLQRDIAENSRRLDELARQIDDATRREQALNAEIDATQSRIETTRFYASNIKAQVQA